MRVLTMAMPLLHASLIWYVGAQKPHSARRAPPGRHFVGERFTAADVYLASQLGWGMQFGTIEKRPAFEQYWQRISTRPAAVRARQIDNALMPAHPMPGATTRPASG